MRLCAAIPIVVTATLSAPACGEGLTRDTLAQAARLSGDALIASACKLRPDSWFLVAMPAVTVELDRLSKNLEPAGGLDPGHVADFIDGAMNQAIDEGTVQWTRYGQAACRAIETDGSLARLDALVAGFKRPSH